MNNIVLCFDRTQDQSGRRASTNAGALFALVESSPRQLTWYDAGAAAQPRGMNALKWRQTAAEAARTSVEQAYRFLVDVWVPGDQIYRFLKGIDLGQLVNRETVQKVALRQEQRVKGMSSEEKAAISSP